MDTGLNSGAMGMVRDPQSRQDLLQFLHELWMAQGKDGEPDDSGSFVDWARRYLAETNRASVPFQAVSNVGVRMSAGEMLLVSPVSDREEKYSKELGPDQRSDIPDVWANSGAVPITGRNQPKR